MKVRAPSQWLVLPPRRVVVALFGGAGESSPNDVTLCEQQREGSSSSSGPGGSCAVARRPGRSSPHLVRERAGVEEVTCRWAAASARNTPHHGAQLTAATRNAAAALRAPCAASRSARGSTTRSTPRSPRSREAASASHPSGLQQRQRCTTPRSRFFLLTRPSPRRSFIARRPRSVTYLPLSSRPTPRWPRLLAAAAAPPPRPSR